MNNRSSATARLFAVIALIAALVLAIVVVGGALGGGDEGPEGTRKGADAAREAEKPKRKTPAVYVIESGDTLIGIAHRTGVPLARIEALNPEVDPQILIAGEELKLR
jgi:LysM repeat protein